MYIVQSAPPAVPLPPRLLAALAVDQSAFANFDALAEPGPGERTHHRISLGETHDVWLIRWGVGSATAMHDHGGSTGALYVADGTLVEYRPGRVPGEGPRRRSLGSRTYRTMQANHVHEVVNESESVAASVHVYSPPLTTMQHYEATDAALRVTHQELVDLGTLQGDAAIRTVDELLADARRSLRRVTPAEAQQAVTDGALLVDIRPSELRGRDGTIPGAVVIDRNVLEWRLDPVGAHRIPEITAPEQVVILFCDEGYASSLAAASLQELGLRNATDLTGGIQDWIRAGLPVDPPA